MTLVSDPGSLLRSTNEGKLGYFLGRDGSQLIPESRKLVTSRIVVVLEPGQLGLVSSRPESTRPGRLGQVNSACVIWFC